MNLASASLRAHLSIALVLSFAALSYAGDMTAEERDQMYREYVAKMNNKNLDMSYDELVAKTKGSNVVVLGGYSGQGYEHPEAVRDYLKQVMKQTGDNSVYVIGGTSDGVGAGYKMIPEIAKELGQTSVKTAGIVSRNAAQYGIAPMDYNVFVDTAPNDWNVVKDGKSLMVKIAKDSNGKMVYLKGGPVSVNELTEAAREGVPATVIRDPNLGPSVETAAKKLLKANPGLDRASPEFKAKLDETMAAADKPTADLARSAPKGLNVANTSSAEGLALPRSASAAESGSALGRMASAAENALTKGVGKLSIASTITGLAAGAIDAETQEALAKGVCPRNFGNSVGTYDALTGVDSSTWQAVAKDCEKKGVPFDFTKSAEKLKNESKGGVGQATCRSDGTIKVVHKSNGMASILKFSNENELASITTYPAGSEADKSYSIQYQKDAKGSWRVATHAKDKSGTVRENDESWKSYSARFACSLNKCKSQDLQGAVDKVDELTSDKAPFGELSSEHSVKAAASMNLVRRLTYSQKGAKPSFKATCELLKDKGASVPEDIAFSDPAGGGSAPAQPVRSAAKSGTALN